MGALLWLNAAAGLGFQLVGSGWTNYCFGCTRKSYPQNCGGFVSVNKGDLGSEKQLAG